MSNNSRPPSTPTTDLKVRQLQSYLHRPGQIATAAHPFVKQMALSQPTPPRSGHPLRDLIKVMLAGFRVMSSLGVSFLAQPLALLLGRAGGRPNRDHQSSPMAEISMGARENVPPLPPEKSTIDGGLDKNE
jgi:hypothetical protein